MPFWPKILDARVILFVGILVFVAAKAFFVLSQTSAMGMPRLGDDSFTHLWRASQIDRIGVWNFIRGDAVETRAGNDILRLCEADSDAPPQVRARCARVADNTAVPDVKPAASLLLHEILRFGLPLKWSYAAFETLNAGIIGIAFAFFLARLFGRAAAGVALVFLAFLTLLPPQGLHQFIPSTLTIGLSLALWGMVIRSDSVLRYVAAGAGFALLSRVHPVALVYAGGLVVLAVYGLQHKLTVKSAFVVTGAALAAFGVFLTLSDTIREVIAQAISANLLDVLESNLRALPNRVATFSIQNWGIVAGFLVSLALCRRVADGWTAAVAGALLAMTAGSLLYRTEFFVFSIPLDLFARVFVGIAVTACGLLAAVLVGLVREKRSWVLPGIAACAVALAVPSFIAWRGSLYGNLNGRPEVINEPALANVVAHFDRASTLAFGELDIAPAAALLAGAADLGAIPMNGLSARLLESAATSRRPAAIVLPNFPILNSLALARSHSFARRRYGFAAEVIDGMAVSLSRDHIARIHLLVENSGTGPVHIGPNAYLDDNKRRHALADLTVPPGAPSWITVEIDPSAEARTVILNLPASGLWIEGISVNEPARNEVDWPWDSEAVVQWHLRDMPRDKIMGVAFTVPALFGYWRTPRLGVLPLAKNNPVISDHSGLVFVGTGYTAPATESN